MSFTYRPFLGLLTLVAVLTGFTLAPAMASSKEKAPAKKELRSRELFYLSEERIPNHFNYMNEAMETADFINYIRQHIASIASKKGYRPHNYGLIANKGKLKKGDYYLEVKTEVNITKKSRAEFVFDVRTSAVLYEGKGGKKIMSSKGKAKRTIKERYKSGIRETVDEAMKSLADKLPVYREHK